MFFIILFNSFFVKIKRNVSRNIEINLNTEHSLLKSFVCYEQAHAITLVSILDMQFSREVFPQFILNVH